MAIPSIGGLLWRSSWSCAGEGPYTILAKMMSVNQIQIKQVRRFLRCGDSQGSDLLTAQPRLVATGAEAEWARLVHRSSLSHRCPRFYACLAGSERLRYCPSCMANGFQPAIAQIEGIDRCPLHDEPMLSACVTCGSKTPPYFVAPRGIIPLLDCPTCSRPLGGVEWGLDAWRAPDGLDRLKPIHAWLERVENSGHFEWLNAGYWRSLGIHEDATLHIRRSVFEALLQLVPTPGLSASQRTVTILGPYDSGFGSDNDLLSAAEYENFYRQLAPSVAPEPYANDFCTPSHGVAVPIDPLVPIVGGPPLPFGAPLEP
jgi:hypothetical protein